VRPKKPRRQRLPWMTDDEDTPGASGDLLTAAAATAKAAVTEASATAAVATEAPMAAAATEAAAVAMAATETELAEAAEVVQAHSLPLPSLCAPTNHVATDRYHTATHSSTQVQVELKKGETILTDASLHLPAACLRKAFSERSGVPADHFELYYRGKRLEGEAALRSWGVEKDATIEVKMRGRGGMNTAGGKQVGGPSSPSKVHKKQKLRDAQGAGVEGFKAGEEASGVIELHGGLTLKLPQASIAYPPHALPCPHRSCSNS
jgi:hypothetical protein